MAEQDRLNAQNELRRELRDAVYAKLGGNMQCPVCGEPLTPGSATAAREAGFIEWRAQIYCSQAGEEHFSQTSDRTIVYAAPPPDDYAVE